MDKTSGTSLPDQITIIPNPGGLTLGTYLATETTSKTPLIPAGFGIVFLLLGLLAFNDKLRKHVMHAASAEHFATALRWSHVPVFVLLVALVGFVRLYLRAGRRWHHHLHRDRQLHPGRQLQRPGQLQLQG